jgi:hypothetical protein
MNACLSGFRCLLEVTIFALLNIFVRLEERQFPPHLKVGMPFVFGMKNL